MNALSLPMLYAVYNRALFDRMPAVGDGITRRVRFIIAPAGYLRLHSGCPNKYFVTLLLDKKKKTFIYISNPRTKFVVQIEQLSRSENNIENYYDVI